MRVKGQISFFTRKLSIVDQCHQESRNGSILFFVINSTLIKEIDTWSVTSININYK